MAEKVHIERPAGLAGDGGQFLPHGIRAEHGTRQGAHSAGIADRHSQGAALDSGHGRLDDGQLDPEEFLQSHCRF